METDTILPPLCKITWLTERRQKRTPSPTIPAPIARHPSVKPYLQMLEPKFISKLHTPANPVVVVVGEEEEEALFFPVSLSPV